MEIFIIIVAVFSVIYFLLPRKYAGVSFAFLVIAFSVMAYSAVPGGTDDLSRYFKAINEIRAGGWDTFQTMLDNNDYDWAAQPVGGYYFYFISLLPNNHFLPAITIFIVYGSMFLMIYKIAQRFSVDKIYLYLGSLFAISTYWFYDTCSGIRNGLAFAVALLCIYYQFVEHKHFLLCCIGYALAIGTHTSGVVIVALGLIAGLTWKIAGKTINILLIFALAASGSIMSLLGENSDNEYILLLTEKTTKASAGGVGMQTNFAVNIATYILGVVIIWYGMYYIKKFVADEGIKKFMRFVEVVMYFMLGCIYSQLIFLRLARWILPVIISIVYMIAMQIQKDRIDGGCVDLTYHSSIPAAERLRVQNKGVTSLLFFSYTAVHLWYDCAGSSLIYLHFK